MARGSRVLVLLSIFITIQRTREMIDRAQCAPDGRKKSVIFMIGLRGWMLVASAWNIYRPRELFYWHLIVLVALYMIFVHVPPFDFSCMELDAFAKQCRALKHWTLRAQRLDCSLQGHTAVQTYSFVMLLLPWLMPRSQYMHFAWLWIIILYFGGSLYIKSWNSSRSYANSELNHDWSDLLIQTAFLCGTLIVATAKKYNFERTQRNKFIDDLKLRDATVKLHHILEGMVPSHVVVPMLTKPGEVIADEVNRVTILFIVICDFDQFARQKTPQQLLGFLNEYFTQFDEICMSHHVTKIETVGEEYVASVGVLPAEKEQTEKEGHGPMLRNMMQAAGKILDIQTQDVKFRMGMHTGPVVAGVIGNKLPRYRLFGDTINTAARMMQKGEDGQLQFGEETKKDVPADVPIICRGEVEMKGKGKIMAYLLDRAAMAKQKTSALGTSAAKSLQASEAKKVTGAKSILNASSNNSETPMKWNKTFQKGVKKVTIMEMLRHPKVRSFQDVEAHTPLVVNSEEPADRTLAPTSTTATSARAGLEGDDKEKQKFDEVMTKLSEGNGTARQWWQFIMTEKVGFTDEMEREWTNSFHRGYSMHHVVYRVNRHLIAVSVMTLFELIYMFGIQSWYLTHEWYDSTFRIPIFVGSRSVCFALLLCWRLHWGHFVKERPLLFQVSLVMTVSLISILFLVSYDAVAIMGKKIDHTVHSKIAVMNEQESLIFVLLFYVIISQARTSFYPSLLFAPLAYVIMKLRNWTHLYISEMGLYIFLCTASLSILTAHDMEQMSRARFKSHHQIAQTKERMEHILNKLLPPLVLKELRDIPESMQTSCTHHYKQATIGQSDLCGFTKLASTRTPREVVEFISELFGAFDALTEKHKIWKIETIGDAYIAGCAEEPLTPENSPISVLLFGMDKVEACEKWAARLRKKSTSPVEVGLRVGIHTGECIGGIVGTDMQRYHIFGDFLCCVEVLESTSVEMKVQVSKACKEAVEKQLRAEARECPILFEERTEENLKTSKGHIHEFSEVGGKTYMIQEDTRTRRSEGGGIFAW